MQIGAITVTELANHSSATPHAVRYYTRMGLLKPVRHPDNGYRLYAPRDIAALKFIRQAKMLGYTLSEIREILHDAEMGNSPCPRVREIIEKRIMETRSKLEELKVLQERMENALMKWSKMPDGIPDGHTICHLIETVITDAADSANKDQKPVNRNAE